MKKQILTILFIISLFSYSLAQDTLKNKNLIMQTLIKQQGKINDIYGTVWGGYCKFKGNGQSFGINAAWLAGNSLGMGIGISGISDTRFWAGGGFFIEPIINPKLPIGISFPTIIGYGFGNEGKYMPSSGKYEPNLDGFVYLEPGIQVEFRFVKHLKLAIGTKVNAVLGSYYYDLNKVSIIGISTFLAVKFGKFNVSP